MLLLRELNAALGILQHPGADITRDTIQLVVTEVLVEQRLPELLAQLLMWLQQRPDLLCLALTSTTAAAAAAAQQQPMSNAMLWQECLECVAGTAIIINGFFRTGELQLQQCFCGSVAAPWVRVPAVPVAHQTAALNLRPCSTCCFAPQLLLQGC
jgi:hypothetical protein